MSSLSTLRRLWQPPARFEDRPSDRRVTFLELFFDLVFVVVISQLARRLAEHPSWSGMGWFIFLFYAVWSSWINGTWYHDLHVAPREPGGIVIGLLGVLVAIGLWWIYFDLVSHRAPISNRTQLWLYLHLPFVIAIAAGGAGILNTVEHAADAVPDAVRWLLVGSLAVAMVSVAAIARTLEIRRTYARIYRPAEIALIASGLLSLGVGLTGWGAKMSLTSMVVLLAAPVATGLSVWLKHTDPETVKLE